MKKIFTFILVSLVSIFAFSKDYSYYDEEESCYSDYYDEYEEDAAYAPPTEHVLVYENS